MANKTENIVQLAVQTAQQIFANNGNYMAFLTTAAHNFKYGFRDQLLIFAQKPDATACAQIDFWNKYGRWVNRGTTGIALLVDTDRGYKLWHVFDTSNTNSREGRTIPIWQMKPQYEGPVVEALENSYGEFADKSVFAECLLQTAKIIVEDNFSDYYTELRGVKEGSLREEKEQNRTFARQAAGRYNGDTPKQEGSVEHGTDVQNRGRLPSAQPGSAGGPEGRKIWDAAAQLPLPAQDGYYTGMQLSGRLNAHLEKIDREATEMVERLTAQMAREQGVTEKLKASDEMKWVGLMNNIRASEEEVVLMELIYTDV